MTSAARSTARTLRHFIHRRHSQAQQQVQLRSIHQGVNVRPLHLSHLHSLAESSFDATDAAAEFGYRVVPPASTTTTEYYQDETDNAVSYEFHEDNNNASGSVVWNNDNDDYENIVMPTTTSTSLDEVLLRAGTLLDTIEAQRDWDQSLVDDLWLPEHSSTE